MSTIINNRKDLDAASPQVREDFISKLLTTVNKWKWINKEWVLVKDTSSLDRFQLSVSDYEISIPPKPDHDPDQIALENARNSASLSRSDFKITLLEKGYLQDIKDFLKNTNDERIIILWEDSQSFHRMDPDLLSLASQMGYTDVQLDRLFGIEISEDESILLNINTSTHQELTELSGVGSSLANAIIDGRPWNSINDLSSISGISQAMIDGWDITTG